MDRNKISVESMFFEAVRLGKVDVDCRNFTEEWKN